VAGPRAEAGGFHGVGGGEGLDRDGPSEQPTSTQLSGELLGIPASIRSAGEHLREVDGRDGGTLGYRASDDPSAWLIAKVGE